MRAISAAAPTSASSNGSLYETAVKRWKSTNASASGPASVVLAAQEHAVPGHEHVVEHGEGLEHLVPRRDRAGPTGGARPRSTTRCRARGPWCCAGTANETAQSASSAFMARVGSTMNSSQFGAERRVGLGAAHDDAVGVLASRCGGTGRDRAARAATSSDRPSRRSARPRPRDPRSRTGGGTPAPARGRRPSSVVSSPSSASAPMSLTERIVPAEQRAHLDEPRPAHEIVGGARDRVERVVLFAGRRRRA